MAAAAGRAWTPKDFAPRSKLSSQTCPVSKWTVLPMRFVIGIDAPSPSSTTFRGSRNCAVSHFACLSLCAPPNSRSAWSSTHSSTRKGYPDALRERFLSVCGRNNGCRGRRQTRTASSGTKSRATHFKHTTTTQTARDKVNTDTKRPTDPFWTRSDDQRARKVPRTSTTF